MPSLVRYRGFYEAFAGVAVDKYLLRVLFTGYVPSKDEVGFQMREELIDSKPLFFGTNLCMMSSNRVSKEIAMRRITVGIAVALITFVLGISGAGAWNFIALETPPKSISYPTIVGDTFTPSQANSVAEQEIRELYRQYDIAQNQHDVEFFERIETDSFVLTYRSGDTLTRAKAIEALKRGGKGITYSNDDLNIQLHGDVAIVTGQITARHSSNEGGYSSHWRWVDLLKNNNGRWQIMSTTQIDNH